ncbi:uncharacterized protein LOC135386945 [Ornithodoros turicata]|uniref:uncharacterized protein LOC135386945 n=1 Tax=Ornithodoros turicata TaxID=34597 RepID=UPI0031393799
MVVSCVRFRTVMQRFSFLGTCCVVPGCSMRSGTNLLSEIRMFSFPRDPQRRAVWTQSIRRDHWKPNNNRKICSTHFIQGKPSDDLTHPDYVPSPFFFKKQQDPEQKLQRYSRLQQRRKRARTETAAESDVPAEAMDEFNEDTVSTQNCALATDQTEHTGTDPMMSSEEIDRILKENCSLKEQVASLSSELQTTKDLMKGHQANSKVLKEALDERTTTKQVLKNDQSVKFHTGVVSKDMFYAILNFILSFWCPNIGTHLEPQEQFLIVLMRLRLGLLTDDLACRFGVSSSCVSAIFHAWLNELAQNLERLIVWPSRHAIRRNLPNAYRDPMFDNVRCVVDCSEIFIHKPSCLKARSQTYSQYKHHNTVRFLVAISPTRAITFISKAWGGRASDKQLTAASKLLEKIEEGDMVLADRGSRCHEMFAGKGASVLMPSFTKGKNQLSGGEVTLSRKM